MASEMFYRPTPRHINLAFSKRDDGAEKSAKLIGPRRHGASLRFTHLLAPLGRLEGRAHSHDIIDDFKWRARIGHLAHAVMREKRDYESGDERYREMKWRDDIAA